MGLSDMTTSLERLVSGKNKHTYTAIPTFNDGINAGEKQAESRGIGRSRQNKRVLWITGAIILVLFIVIIVPW